MIIGPFYDGGFLAKEIRSTLPYYENILQNCYNFVANSDSPYDTNGTRCGRCYWKFKCYTECRVIDDDNQAH